MAKISFIVFAIFFTFVSSNNENDIIQIVNSGSSNTAGYTIELKHNGLVQWTVSRRSHQIFSTTPSGTTTQNNIRLPTARTQSIFESVEEALPFNQYPPNFCMKSVSFGTSLHVTFNGQQSPDLNCPLKDQRLINMQKYVQGLVSDLHINTLG